MGNITVIPAKRQVGNNITQEENPKLRVAAYCRVSTDSDEQATSYEVQIEHYTEFIQKNPNWVLAGIFADDGISGTNTKRRDEFNRMIDECMSGNRILCKKDDFLKTLQSNITAVITQSDMLSPEVIDERLHDLQRELLKKVNQKEDYDAIANEIIRLKDMRKQSEVDSVVKDEQIKLITDLQDFIREQPKEITEFDETLVKRLIDRITVFDEYFTVEFKSGVVIEIENLNTTD